MARALTWYLGNIHKQYIHFCNKKKKKKKKNNNNNNNT